MKPVRLRSAACCRGGGLAVIHRQDLELSPIPLPTTSCECLAFKCKSPFPMTVLLIYRPPKTNSAFILEISDLLTTLCTTSANTIILGDLNIHVNTSSCHSAADFLQLLDSLNLQQHVDVLMSPHTQGDTHSTWSSQTPSPSPTYRFTILVCLITE